MREADAGVGGGLGGAAAVQWRRRQRVEKQGGRWAMEWEWRTWVSVAGWDLDLDLVTYCAVNWLTIAQARRQTEMHSGRQRAEV